MTGFTIYNWMTNDLDLKGGDLLVYALVYSFSHDSQGCFFGTAGYAASATGLARETVARVFRRLTEIGLLKRSDGYHNGTPTVDYIAVRRCDKKSQGGVTKNHTGCDETSHGAPIISHISEDITGLSEESPDACVPACEEFVYREEGGQPVKMSSDERANLNEEYGAADAAAAVTYLSLYKGEKPYKSKSDYLAIRRWVIDAVRERRARELRAKAMPASTPYESQEERDAKARRIAEGLAATRRHPEDYADPEALKEGADDDLI